MSAWSFRRLAAASASAAVAVTGAAAHVALANPVLNLAGRWSGPGSIVMASGETEQMRCVATYFVDGGGGSVKQNLRCASQGYKIDAISNLTVANGRVSGGWEERTWDTKGSIKGDVQTDGFNLTIDGPGFTAAMAVKTSNCTQSISITPRGNIVARISMSLGKC